MTVQISEAELEKIAGICDGIEDTGKKIAGLPEPCLDGWASQQSMTDGNERWQQKTIHAGGQWRYMGSAVRATGDAITATDRHVAFTFPAVGKGETDIPIPAVFELYDTQPPGPPFLNTGGN